MRHIINFTGDYGLARHGAVFQTLFSTPKPQPIPAPAPMPTPDDQATNVAKRRAQAAAQTRTGRQSTILTDYGQASGKFGG